MDSGLVFIWLPKLFIISLAVGMVVRVLVRPWAVGLLSGAISPIAYDVLQVSGAPASSHFWLHDLPLLSAFALLATVPGAIIGVILGRFLYKSRNVR